MYRFLCDVPNPIVNVESFQSSMDSQLCIPGQGEPDNTVVTTVTEWVTDIIDTTTTDTFVITEVTDITTTYTSFVTETTNIDVTDTVVVTVFSTATATSTISP
jgi:hypothetical protein